MNKMNMKYLQKCNQVCKMFNSKMKNEKHDLPGVGRGMECP